MKPTPGPWWYQENSDVYTHIIRSGENRFVLSVRQSSAPEAEADARLIVASVNAIHSAAEKLGRDPVGLAQDLQGGGLEKIAVVLDACHTMMTDAMWGLIQKHGPIADDMELKPDGSMTLKDLRAALTLLKGK